MSWKTFTGSAWTLPFLLAMLCVLAACSPTLSTLTGGTDAAKTVGSVASDVCRAWKPTTYSSRDTPETQVQVRANNATRDAYCKVR